MIRVLMRQGQPVQEEDGICMADGKLWGTYFHGLFDDPGFRRAFLGRLRPGLAADAFAISEGITAFRDRQYDLLADHFRAHLDLDKLVGATGLERE